MSKRQSEADKAAASTNAKMRKAWVRAVLAHPDARQSEVRLAFAAEALFLSAKSLMFFPAPKKLMQSAGVGSSSFYASMAFLKHHGFIEPAPHPNGGDNCYRITLPNDADGAAIFDDDDTEPVPKKSAAADTGQSATAEKPKVEVSEKVPSRRKAKSAAADTGEDKVATEFPPRRTDHSAMADNEVRHGGQTGERKEDLKLCNDYEKTTSSEAVTYNRTTELTLGKTPQGSSPQPSVHSDSSVEDARASSPVATGSAEAHEAPLPTDLIEALMRKFTAVFPNAAGFDQEEIRPALTAALDAGFRSREIIQFATEHADDVRDGNDLLKSPVDWLTDLVSEDGDE